MSEESITVPDAKTIAAYESTHYFAHEAKPVLVRVGDPAKSHQAWLEKMGARSLPHLVRLALAAGIEPDLG